jgi:hypothetical protein
LSRCNIDGLQDFLFTPISTTLRRRMGEPSLVVRCTRVEATYNRDGDRYQAKSSGELDQNMRVENLKQVKCSWLSEGAA